MGYSYPPVCSRTTSNIPQVSVAADIIAIKNAASLVAAHFHGRALRNPGTETSALGRRDV